MTLAARNNPHFRRRGQGAGLPSNVRTVDKTATGAGNGLTWADAFNTIAAARLVADPLGYEIWVRGGQTYAEQIHGNAYQYSSIIRGGFDTTESSSDERILIPTNYTVLSGSSNLIDWRTWGTIGLTLDGFQWSGIRGIYIANGSQFNFLNLYLDMDAKARIINAPYYMKNVEILGGGQRAVTAGGGGLAKLEDCLFSGLLGGPFFFGTMSVIIDRCRILNCTATAATGGLYLRGSGGHTVRDTIVAGCSTSKADEGGGISVFYNTSLIGCTMMNNSHSGGGVGGIKAFGGTIAAKNTIQVNGTNGTVTYTDCLTGGTPEVDGSYIPTDGGNCHNTGNSVHVVTSLDVYQNTRIVGASVDLGAVERQ